ncbi:MAG: ABC transporter ATP-binding protein [Deltaproteobacteria bacterium]|jgi:NitT/TauT family transport system ATP-binding protein|nr:ABC transporter ATP-binding protein [Deltaproteobacteria bacterium]
MAQVELSAPKIQAKSVERTFVFKNDQGRRESLHVLAGFDLDVRKGEFLSIIGPSGCGKSTFLNILAGLDDFDGGEILIDQEGLKRRSFDRGLVFQNYALMPWRTVRGNLEMGLEIRKVPRKERREIAKRYLELVGLSRFSNQYPHQLSGGMKQRVAIARALTYEPDLLLMDEPFGALDAQTREILQIELLRIWEADKKTILFVTHSLDEAVLMSDRVAVMTARTGRVKAVLEIDLPRPRTEEVRNSAEFLRARQTAWTLLRDEVGLACQVEGRA